MKTHNMIIRSVSRLAENGKEERLSFLPGVNILVGKPNTGKTKWLSTLDYLFGSALRCARK
jgi:AAA15 family ATPase/GTPase